MTPKLKTMYEHAIAKWQWIVDNWDYRKSFGDNIDNLIKCLSFCDKYLDNCSFCSKYRFGPIFGCTDECPIYKNHFGCMKEYSHHHKWAMEVKYENEKNAKQAALNLLTLIKKLYEEAKAA